jgi:hypothetical protein
MLPPPQPATKATSSNAINHINKLPNLFMFISRSCDAERHRYAADSLQLQMPALGAEFLVLWSEAS